MYYVLYVSKSSGSRQDVYVYYTCGYFIFLTLVTVFLLYVYLPTTNNAVARYGFPNTTLQLERIDLTAAWIGKRRKRNKKTEKKKMVTLTILLHPQEKSRVGRVRYCQRRRRRVVHGIWKQKHGSA